MESNFTDLIGDYKPLDLDVFDTSIGYDRAKEIVEQHLFQLLDQSFWDFPSINANSIGKNIEEINKFLKVNNIEQDRQLLDFISKGLHQSIREYPWNDTIYKW